MNLLQHSCSLGILTTHGSHTLLTALSSESGSLTLKHSRNTLASWYASGRTLSYAPVPETVAKWFLTQIVQTSWSRSMPSAEAYQLHLHKQKYGSWPKFLDNNSVKKKGGCTGCRVNQNWFWKISIYCERQNSKMCSRQNCQHCSLHHYINVYYHL